MIYSPEDVVISYGSGGKKVVVEDSEVIYPTLTERLPKTSKRETITLEENSVNYNYVKSLVQEGSNLANIPYTLGGEAMEIVSVCFDTGQITIKPKPKVQTYMVATNVEVDCPYCNKRQDGFFGNPQGGKFVCDDCGETYIVHKEADIEIC